MADTAYQPPPWVKTVMEEQNLLDGLAGICLANGWKKVAEFTKITYSNQLTRPTIKRFFLPLSNPKVTIPNPLNGDYYIYLDGKEMPVSYYTTEEDGDNLNITFDAGASGTASIYYSTVQASDEYTFIIGKHYIIKNVSGNLFGMAQVAKVTEQIGNTGQRVPFTIPDDDETYGTKLSPQSDGIFSWAVQQADEDKLYERHTLYFYQLEKWIGNGKMHTGWQTTDEDVLRRLAVDAEVQTSMWDLQDSSALKFTVTDKFPQMYQSPITVARTRIPQLEVMDKVALMNVKYTNWWEDSKVRVKGFVDGRSTMLIIEADTAPIWQDNAVPSIPLYMGDFNIKEEAEEVVKRDIIFDFLRKTTRSSTVISSKPMTNEGSYVRVWLMGDANGDFPNESIKLTIAGEEIGDFNTSYDTPPTNNRGDAQFMGEFDLTGVEGKTSITIQAESGDGVGGAGDYTPVGARMFLELSVDTASTTDKAPSAIFSGTALTRDRATAEAALAASGRFDYDDVDLKQPLLLPMLKEYQGSPSNGIDSVMVNRNKYGARYQAHYLSWALAPNDMPPLREDSKGHKHPRAWNNYLTDVYKFKFNTSRYSEKTHSSRATLIHPEDGKFGTLRNVILVSPLTIMNGDELEVVKDHCAPDEDKFSIYSYMLVEGISPLTKRPATAFRPAGLGIIKEGYDLPEIPPDPPAPPDLLVALTPPYVEVVAGSSVQYTAAYSKHSPLTNFKWQASSDVNRGSFSADNAIFTFNSTGTYNVTLTVWNEAGQSGLASATVVVNPKPIPPPPPPPPPPPNTIQCGVQNDTGGGRYTEKFHELGTVTGTVKIDYDMYSAPDRMDVYYQNQLLATTNGEVMNKGSLSFSYRPVNGVTQIKVVITNTAGNSNWEYMVNCPT